ncbi:MAG: pyridoxamine 5'-phosphate oxidase family protein [Candidatus Sericytochromatia bacterium]|nr:pyridoxamine 5'-phosphate oxidase family protein [Candidatus Sericytochromatia bacterium]
MDRKSSIKKINELIKDVRIAMMTTEDEDGSLRSRPMGTQQVEFDGDLWFFTGKDSTKVREVNKNHQVNVSYSNPESNTYVSVSGEAQLITDKDKMKELWSPLLKAWFPDGLDDPNLSLIKVNVEKAEFWDSPSSKMVMLVGFVKAIVTGKTYQPSDSEHQKVKL